MNQKLKEALARIQLDIEEIKTRKDRTGHLRDKPVRWEGTDANINGYRRLADMAEDLELILENIE